MTHSRRLGVACGLLLAAGLAASPAAASVVDPLSGAMDLSATANIGDPALATKTDSDHREWSSVPTALSTLVRATATRGDDSITVHAQETGVWVSPDKGSVHVTDFGHEFNVSSEDVNQVESLMGGSLAAPDWTYVFRATQNGVFSLDAEVTGRGDNLFGLGAWQLAFVGDGQEFAQLSNNFAGVSNPGDNAHTGSFSHALVPGQTYRVSLINQNSLGAFSPNHQSASMDASFDWRITAAAAAGVPEPSAWMLSIAGFGLAGAALRRRSLLAES